MFLTNISRNWILKIALACNVLIKPKKKIDAFRDAGQFAAKPRRNSWFYRKKKNKKKKEEAETIAKCFEFMRSVQ